MSLKASLQPDCTSVNIYLILYPATYSPGFFEIRPQISHSWNHFSVMTAGHLRLMPFCNPLKKSTTGTLSKHRTCTVYLIFYPATQVAVKSTHIYLV